MLVLFLSFVFAVIMVKSELVKLNKTEFKDQLQKSLTHVNEMLAEIEYQIESERKKISRLDDGLNYEETPPGYLNYEVTDIWWPANVSLSTSNPTAAQTSILQPLSTGTSNLKVTNISSTSTQSTNKTQTQENTSPTTVHDGWPFKNTPHPGGTPFIQELHKAMEMDKFGYFTIGLTKFLELVSIKDPRDVSPILDGMVASVGRLLQEHVLVAFTKTLQIDMVSLLTLMMSMDPDTLQQQAGKGVYVLKNKYTHANDDLNGCLEQYDSAFKPSEGDALFGSLEGFDKYPDGGHRAIEVSRDMLRAALAPFLKLPSEDQAAMVDCLNHGFTALYTELRMGNKSRNTPSIMSKADTMSSSVANGSKTLSDSQSGLPSRRHLGHSSKKLMRHFLKKHRTLFKRLSEHHKRKKHHHSHHKVHHHSYHKKHKKHHNKQHEERDHDDQHDKRGPQDKPDKRGPQVKPDKRGPQDKPDKRGPQAKPNIPEKPKILDPREQLKQYLKMAQTYRKMGLLGIDGHEGEADTSGSDAFFQGTKQNNKPISQNRNVTRNRIETARKLFGDNYKVYIKEIAKKLREKLTSRNYRRGMTLTSENKSTEKYESPKNIRIVDKIREVSSYSDEEYHLRTNLYDAFVHGNKKSVQNDVNDINNMNNVNNMSDMSDMNNMSDRNDVIDMNGMNDMNNMNDTSGGFYSDDEVIIENNLYKVS